MNLTLTLRARRWCPWMMLGLTLFLSACAPIAGPISDSPTPTTVAEESATEPVTETIGMTETVSLTELSAAEQQLVERAMAVVTTETGLAATDLTLVDLRPMEWPDSSLGCPQPDTMYMQVITPGYQLTLEDASGATHAIHAAADPSGQIILCQEEGQ